MIQVVLRTTKVCLLLIITLFFSGCRVEVESPNLFNSIAGSGKVVTQERAVTANFNKIQSSSSFKVEVEQAPHYEIVVKADDNLLPYIVTEVEQNTLKIRFDNVSVRNIKEIKVYVKTPHINSLYASSSSEIEVKKSITSDYLDLKTSSTGEIKVNEISTNSLLIEASSASEIRINNIYALDFKAQASSTAEIEIDYVESDKIKLVASSSSDIEIKGKTLELELNTNSTAEINAKELLANNITATASSSSTIQAHPIVSLKAKASSTADIYYYNEPNTIEKSTSSSGSIKKR